MKPEILHPVILPQDVEAVAKAAATVDGAMAALDGLRMEVMRQTGAPDCVLTCTCTQALRLALKVLIGPHDAPVVIPDLTFVATAHAVLASGNEPWVVDVDADTLHISIPNKEDVEGAAAVLPVELLGVPLSDKLVNALTDYGAPIIVDAAQSFGATRWRDEYRAMCISFAANKIVHGHQGGAVLCSMEDAATLRKYLRHGRDMSRLDSYYHETLGENLAMNPLGAALALSQCKRIGSIMEHRREQRRVYQNHGVMRVDNRVGNCWVHVGNRKLCEGKPSDILWQPLHTFKHLREYSYGDYPNATAAYNDLVFLPSSDDTTVEQIEEAYK